MILMAIHLIVAFLGGIYVFLSDLNKTVIRVTPAILEIKQVGPLASTEEFDPANIKQFYTKKKVRKNNVYYTLYMVTEERHKSLVTDLKQPEQARYLEQQIEQMLGLKDYPMTDDEFKRDKILNIWQTLKKSYNLKLTSEGNDIQARGNYRGYQLEFEALGKIFSQTRLSLTASQNTAVSDEALTPQAVERLLTPRTAKFGWRGKVQIEAGGQVLDYEQIEVELDVDFLQFLFDKCCDLLDAYPKIIAVGGEMAPALQTVADQSDHPFHSIAHQLLQNISQETTARLQDKAAHLLCPSCLTRCDKHELGGWLTHYSFYGCRTCGRSRELLAVP